MAWAAFDDDVFFNPKVVAAGRDARDLWMAAIVYCNHAMTDGYVDPSAVPLIVAMAGIPTDAAEACIARLLEVRLLDAAGPGGDVGDGWWVHDYLVYQRSREEILESRAQRAAEAAAGDEDQPPLAKAERKRRRSRARPGAMSRSEAARRAAQVRWAAKPTPVDGADASGQRPHGSVAVPEGIEEMRRGTEAMPHGIEHMPHGIEAMPHGMPQRIESMPQGMPQRIPPLHPPLAQDPIPSPCPLPDPSPDPRQQQQQPSPPPRPEGRAPASVATVTAEESDGEADGETDGDWAFRVAEMAGITGGSALAHDETARLWALCGHDRAFWDAALRECARHGARTLAYLSSVIEVNMANGTMPGQSRQGRFRPLALAGEDEAAFEAAYRQVREAEIGTGSASERRLLYNLWKSCEGDDQALFFAAAIEDAVAHGGRSFAYLEKVIDTNVTQGTWPGWHGVPRQGAAAEWCPDEAVARAISAGER